MDHSFFHGRGTVKASRSGSAKCREQKEKMPRREKWRRQLAGRPSRRAAIKSGEDIHKVHDAVRIAPLVVIPVECFYQRAVDDLCKRCVENGGVAITYYIGRNDRFFLVL